MPKVAPQDDVPAEEARDAFPVPQPDEPGSASGAASGIAPPSAPAPPARPTSTMDRAKMNITRGSQRMIQLFDTKNEINLDLDQFYKATLRRRTHLEQEITGTLVRGGIDVSQESDAPPRATRGKVMALSPGEEYENYHKVDMAIKFQQAIMLGDDVDGDEDEQQGKEEDHVIHEAEEEEEEDYTGSLGKASDKGGDEVVRAARSAQIMPVVEDKKRKRALPVGSLPIFKKHEPLPLIPTLPVSSPTLKRLIKRNTMRTQAKMFARSKKMINPHGRIRLVWDLISIVFILYNAFVLPFRASFNPSNAEEDGFDLFLDTFFMFDILVMFNTAVEVDGSVKYSRRIAAKMYLRSWFLVDLIAALPYDDILPHQSADTSSTLRHSLKLLRLIRLLRLFRISRIFRRIQNAIFIRSTMTSLLKYCLMVMFVSHWFSCIFHAIAASKEGNNWITTNHLQDPYGTKWDRYVAALYFSVMTLATIGYGDVAGVDADERLFSIFAMIIGGGIFAYGITNIVELVSSLTVSETRFRQKMDEVNEYMAARELPMKVRMEIREFYHNTRQSRESKLNGEQQILAELSSKLRSKIALSINDQFLRRFPFFAGSDPNFLLELALNMRMIHFAQLEDVIIEGEIGHEMFFIFRGAVEVLRGGQQIGILGENQYFGEMAILSPDNRRRATVRTLCFCELRMLSRNRFLDALALFPAMQAKMAQVARSRLPMHQPSKSKKKGGEEAPPPPAATAEKPPPPDEPSQTPPPELEHQQSSKRSSIGTTSSSSTSSRLLLGEERRATKFMPVRTTTSARLNAAVRRASTASPGGGISSSMALALSETSAKLEEATRRQEMLVAAVMKLHGELERLVPSD